MRYVEDFLTADESSRMLAELRDEVSWQRETFPMFGRRVEVPRHLAWFGDHGVNYRYTGHDHCATGWPTLLQNIRRRVMAEAACAFNFVLLNRYDNGSHHMGWHRDDERGAQPTIASVSLGAVRRFRYGSNPGQVRSIDVQDGSLLVFDGRVRHQLARSAKPLGMRINLTFRQIQTAAP